MKIIDNYKRLGFKEFMKQWKEGIVNLTPLQQVKSQLPGYVLILIGVTIGLIVTYINKTWWLFIILLGGAWIQIITFLGVIQKYLMLKNIDDELNIQKGIREVTN